MTIKPLSFLIIQPKQIDLVWMYFCTLQIFVQRRRGMFPTQCVSLYMRCFCISPAEMGLFPTTQFPGNRTPISLRVHCLWWLPCGAWLTHRRARWVPVPVWRAACDWVVKLTWIAFVLMLMHWEFTHVYLSVCLCSTGVGESHGEQQQSHESRGKPYGLGYVG